MSYKISVEYCTSWNYLPRAVSLVNNILGEHKDKIRSLSIIPSSGGVFEITLDDQLIFSKKELGRFPEVNEVENSIKEKIS